MSAARGSRRAGGSRASRRALDAPMSRVDEAPCFQSAEASAVRHYRVSPGPEHPAQPVLRRARCVCSRIAPENT